MRRFQCSMEGAAPKTAAAVGNLVAYCGETADGASLVVKPACPKRAQAAGWNKDTIAIGDAAHDWNSPPRDSRI